MMKQLTGLAILAVIPCIGLADERPYAFTYEPVVSAQGEVELELYETMYQPRQAAGGRTWEHKVEVGYGLTERLSLSVYAVTRTTPATRLESSAFKLEGRYKLLDAADFPVDLVIYLEAEKEVVDDKPWGLEEKVILGRNHGRLSWALNLVAEQEFPSAGGSELKLGWSAGVAAEPVRGLRLGVESFGNRARAVDGSHQLTAYAGPTGSVSLPFLGSLGANSGWLIVGAGFGLNDASDRVWGRAVIGCDF